MYICNLLKAILIISSLKEACKKYTTLTAEDFHNFLNFHLPKIPIIFLLLNLKASNLGNGSTCGSLSRIRAVYFLQASFKPYGTF